NVPVAPTTTFAESAQSFSLSFWMLQGATAGEEVLFSRNDMTSELSTFGLLSRPTPGHSDSFDLVWLNGALTDPAATRTSIKEVLPINKWTHVGLSVDAIQRSASVYVDGALARSISFAVGALATCPQVTASPASTRVTIHEEGDFATVAGTGPESLYFGFVG